MATSAPDRDSADRRHPDEKIPLPLAAGLALQIAALVLPGTVVITTVVFRAGGQPESVLLWAVFASVAACGATTLLQALRAGRFGAGYILAVIRRGILTPIRG